MVTPRFHPHVESEHHLVQHNKQYHVKVLLNSSYLNGHALGFHPHTQSENRLVRTLY